MAIKTKVGGAWHDAKSQFTKVGGTWRGVKGAWAKVGGVWRRTYTGNLDTWVRKYLQNPERIYGSCYAENYGTYLQAYCSGYTGGESRVMAVGWTFVNLPTDKAVTVEFALTKGDIPQNDGVVYTAAGTVINYTASTGRITRTFEGHGGWISIVLNFFCESQYATTSYLNIYRVAVGDVQIYPMT